MKYFLLKKTKKKQNKTNKTQKPQPVHEVVYHVAGHGTYKHSDPQRSLAWVQ